MAGTTMGLLRNALLFEHVKLSSHEAADILAIPGVMYF
jgi:hypothetical protein